MNADLLSLLDEANRNLLGMARRHVMFGPCCLYLRIGPKVVDGGLVRCLQIGTADVSERDQGKGHFKRALSECFALGLPIYIESVQNVSWGDYLLEKQGFRVLNSHLDGMIRDLFHPAKIG